MCRDIVCTAKEVILHPSLKASSGWIERFMLQCWHVTRVKTTAGQTFPKDAEKKVGDYDRIVFLLSFTSLLFV